VQHAGVGGGEWGGMKNELLLNPPEAPTANRKPCAVVCIVCDCVCAIVS
jgi:hypothetical protein